MAMRAGQRITPFFLPFLAARPSRASCTALSVHSGSASRVARMSGRSSRAVSALVFIFLEK